MSRAELRRQARKEAKKGKVYTLTQAQIDKMKEECVDEAVSISFGLMLAIPAKKLLDYWKKTAPKRIPEFLDDCIKIYGEIGTKEVKVSELIREIEETCNIKMNCVERIKKLKEMD
jgi:hypothetical protein